MDQRKDDARLSRTPGSKENLPIAWADENAMAIEERRAWIEANGLPLADQQVLKLD